MAPCAAVGVSMCWEVFRTLWWKSRTRHSAAGLRAGRNTFRFQVCPRRVRWRLSCCFFRNENHVCRAAVLSIVLTLAVGQNAPLLLCRAWCDQQAAAASGCHHQNPAPSLSMAGDDSCDNVLIAAFLREQVRRGVSSPDRDHAIPVLLYQLAPSATDVRPGQQPGRECSLETRPLSTVLRT